MPLHARTICNRGLKGLLRPEMPSQQDKVQRDTPQNDFEGLFHWPEVTQWPRSRWQCRTGL